MDAGLPIQLQQPLPQGQTVGSLHLHDRDWRVEAPAHVLQLLSHKFYVFFHKHQIDIPATRYNTAELARFITQYPLTIESPEPWNNILGAVRKKMLIQRSEPPSPDQLNRNGRFKGKLYSYQAEGVRFMYCNRRCLLGDEMGLGKTVQALALVNLLQQGPVLVVALPHLVRQWYFEIQGFLGKNTSVELIRGTKPRSLPQADFYLTHYLLLRNWYEELIRHKFPTLILDEVQELRHAGTKKYSAAANIAEQAQAVFGLSGTPIYNYRQEIFNIMEVIDRGCLGNAPRFERQWCSGEEAKDHVSLGAHLRERGLFLRRRKDEVAIDLPEKRRALQHIDQDDQLFIDLSFHSREIAKTIHLAEDKSRQSLLFTAINNLRRATGIAKAQHVAEFMKLLLESGEPCLLFAFHHDVMDLYRKYLKKYHPLFVTGRESAQEKDEHIQRFMAGETNLLIVNFRTTAGLNLQRGRCAVFGELDWSPAIHQQAEDRLHRIGQKNHVMVYYLVSESMMDEKIMECLMVKENEFREVTMDKAQSSREIEEGQMRARKMMWEILSRINRDSIT